MKTNYHTHTFRCGHAKNFLDEEYVLSAIQNGFNELGFSDHAMFSDIYNEYGMRAPYNELEGYIKSISELKEKYKDQIKIYTAMECEYFNEYYDELKELLDSKKMDYLIFGNHFFRHIEGKIFTEKEMWTSEEFFDVYVDKAIEALNSKLFKIFAHPDLVFLNYKKWNKHVETRLIEMLEVAKQNDVYIEFNMGGFRRGMKQYGDEYRYPYPYMPFFKLVKQVGNKVVIGVDAHDPKELGIEEYERALKITKELNLKIEDKIEF